MSVKMENALLSPALSTSSPLLLLLSRICCALIAPP